MKTTAVIYDPAVKQTAYILGTVIGFCKLFPAERAPRDWGAYGNVVLVTQGESGPVVTVGMQERVTFRPKGEDETVAAAELIASAFNPIEKPMPDAMLAQEIEAFLQAHNTLALATGCGKWVRCTPLEYRCTDGNLYIVTEGGRKFKGIWWNGAVSAAVYDDYKDMRSTKGLQITGRAVYIDPADEEYERVMQSRGLQLVQLQQLPSMLHVLRIDVERYEFLNAEFREKGYDGRQVLNLK
ncbi:MAG: pyridoxamine 5'-phosphate oxidase family protein [Oscillospiraceae bacterium]